MAIPLQARLRVANLDKAGACATAPSHKLSSIHLPSLRPRSRPRGVPLGLQTLPAVKNTSASTEAHTDSVRENDESLVARFGFSFERAAMGLMATAMVSSATLVAPSVPSALAGEEEQTPMVSEAPQTEAASVPKETPAAAKPVSIGAQLQAQFTVPPPQLFEADNYADGWNTILYPILFGIGIYEANRSLYLTDLKDKKKLLIKDYPRGVFFNIENLEPNPNKVAGAGAGSTSPTGTRNAGSAGKSPIARTGLKKKLPPPPRRAGTKTKALGTAKSCVLVAMGAGLAVSTVSPQMAEAVEQQEEDLGTDAPLQPFGEKLSAALQGAASSSFEAQALTSPDVLAATSTDAVIQEEANVPTATFSEELQPPQGRQHSSFLLPAVAGALTYVVGTKKKGGEKRSSSQSLYAPPRSSKPVPKSSRVKRSDVPPAPSSAKKTTAAYSMKNARAPGPVRSGLKKKRAPIPRTSGPKTTASPSQGNRTQSKPRATMAEACHSGAMAGSLGPAWTISPVHVPSRAARNCSSISSVTRPGRERASGISTQALNLRRKPAAKTKIKKTRAAAPPAKRSTAPKAKPKAKKTKAAAPPAKRSTAPKTKPKAKKATSRKSVGKPKRAVAVKGRVKAFRSKGAKPAKLDNASVAVLGVAGIAALSIFASSGSQALQSPPPKRVESSINIADYLTEATTTTVVSAPSPSTNPKTKAQKEALAKVSKEKAARQQTLQKQAQTRRQRVEKERSKKAQATKAAQQKLIAKRAADKKAAAKKPKFSANDLKKKKKGNALGVGGLLVALGGGALAFLSTTKRSGATEENGTQPAAIQTEGGCECCSDDQSQSATPAASVAATVVAIPVEESEES